MDARDKAQREGGDGEVEGVEAKGKEEIYSRHLNIEKKQHTSHCFPENVKYIRLYAGLSFIAACEIYLWSL